MALVFEFSPDRDVATDLIHNMSTEMADKSWKSTATSLPSPCVTSFIKDEKGFITSAIVRENRVSYPPVPNPTYAPMIPDGDEAPFQSRILNRLGEGPKVSPAPPPTPNVSSPSKKESVNSSNHPLKEASPNNPEAATSKSKRFNFGISLKGLSGKESSRKTVGATSTSDKALPITPTKTKQGWKRAVDAKSGQTYYYNSATKETRWNNTNDFDQIEPASVAEEDTPKKESSGRWKSALDDGSGQTYYYHTGRKEITRVKPDDFEEEELPSENPDPPKTVESGGWKSVLDTTTGKTYYYQARWEKPVEFDEEEAKADEMQKSPKKGRPGRWKTVVDSTSGQTYYYHSKTKETRWDKPDEGFHEDEALTEEKQKSPKKGGPGRWKTVVDSTNGQTYYYHSKTKETRWDKPEGYDEQELSSNSKKKSPKKAGPGRWKSALDKDSGLTYYYHTGRKEISWVKPDDFGGDHSPPPSPKRQARLPHPNSPPPLIRDHVRCSLREEEEAAAERRIRQLEEAHRARAEEQAQRRAEEEAHRAWARGEAKRLAMVEAGRVRAKEQARRRAEEEARRILVERETRRRTEEVASVIREVEEARDSSEEEASKAAEEGDLQGEGAQTDTKRTPREMEEILARAKGWRR